MKTYDFSKTMMLVNINEVRRQAIRQLNMVEENGDFNELSNELIKITDSEVSKMCNVITIKTEYDMLALDEALEFDGNEKYILKQLKDLRLLKLALENHLNKCYNIIELILNEL